MPSNNPRNANWKRRKQIRDRLLQTQDTCALCGLPIDKSLKSPHPMSPEVDEIVPVSKFWMGGYASQEECALDPDNCQLVHRICNQRKGNHTKPVRVRELGIPVSRQWL